LRIAYLIRAHHAPDLLARLVRRLDAPDAHFYVHVNARTNEDVFREMVARLEEMPNVWWLPRVKCYYGGFSLVRATLLAIREIGGSETPFDYVILLSGQDYPLKPPAEIEAFLRRQQDRSFLAWYSLPSDNWRGERGGLDRFERWYSERLAYRTRMIPLPLPRRRRLPLGLTPYGGSAFWCLSREAVVHVHRMVREHPEVTEFFEHTKIPDELFFQTVLMNSPLASNIVNDDLRYVDWSAGGVHPATLRAEDFEKLRNSDKLFARKFDPEADASILDLLDRELLAA
jgi:hypothetical protein